MCWAQIQYTFKVTELYSVYGKNIYIFINYHLLQTSQLIYFECEVQNYYIWMYIYVFNHCVEWSRNRKWENPEILALVIVWNLYLSFVLLITNWYKIPNTCVKYQLANVSSSNIWFLKISTIFTSYAQFSQCSDSKYECLDCITWSQRL